MMNNAQRDFVLNKYPELIPYIHYLAYEDVEFLMSRVGKFPASYTGKLLKRYFSFDRVFERNSFIRDLTDKTESGLPLFAESLDSGRHDIHLIAQKSLDYLNLVYRTFTRTPAYTYTENRREPNSYTGSFENDRSLYRELLPYMYKLKIEPLEVRKGRSETGCIRRMLSMKWLKSRIRTQLTQAVETVAIGLGEVSRKRSLYVSTETARKHQQQKESTLRYLETSFLKNESGEVISLFDCFKSSVSNPENRRNELMTRIAGTEKIARERGDLGLFITVTCPSKYHNNSSRSGRLNRKWDGSLPNQSQGYLKTVWARARAELKRREIGFYGLRVVEPQHDGTPHWHLLLFVNPQREEALSEVIRGYALQEDGDEKGALENRCDIKRIDPTRGSAAGYIAKYIAKNIDGQGLDSGVYGECPNLAAIHVAAWASCWSIRQFQAFGQPSVTVWRELRRLVDSLPEGSPFEALRQAADTGDWGAYILLMGGVATSSRSRPVKPLYEPKVDIDTGEIGLSEYDREIEDRLSGVTDGNAKLLTRRHNWSRCSALEAV